MAGFLRFIGPGYRVAVGAGGAALRFAGRLFVPSKEAVVKGSQVRSSAFRIGLGVTAADVATGSHGRKELASGASDAFDGLKGLPIIGDSAQQALINMSAFGGDVLSAPFKVFNDAVQTNLKNNGHEDTARFFEVAGKAKAIPPILFFVAMSKDGHKANMLVGRMKANDISEADMVEYISANRDVLAKLEEVGLSTEELYETLPTLKAALDIPVVPAAGVAGGLDGARDLAADFGGQAKGVAGDVAQGAAKLTGFAKLMSFLDNLGDMIVDFFNGIINDIFGGNSVGQGNLKFANADVPDFELKSRGPAPELDLA